MGMPTDIGIVDTMISFPIRDKKKLYSFITKQTKDAQSKGEYDFPVEYMFKGVPDEHHVEDGDPVDMTLREMDRWGVEKGLIGVGPGSDSERALKDHPDRFIGGISTDPNRGMDAVRDIRKAYETWGIRAVDIFPAGTFPQVPINDKKMYPIYATCVELGIPVFVCAGIP